LVYTSPAGQVNHDSDVVEIQIFVTAHKYDRIRTLRKDLAQAIL